MKKIFSVFILGFSFVALHAQDASDAMRYAQTNLNGTARFSAMGGAFGALGGDLSALSVNPAGSVIFSNNQTGLTLSSFNISNDANYFGKKNTDSKSVASLNQAGATWVFETSNSDWNKLAFAINYENINNFDNSSFAIGTNPTNSIDKYFLSYANANPNINQGGIFLRTIRDNYYTDLSYKDQQAFLGYEGYIINPIPLSSDPSNSNNPNITSYNSNVPAGGKYYQENSVVTTGYNGKVSFNVSTSYKDKLYLGLNLNSHFTDFRKMSSFYEQNNNSTTQGVRNLTFDNDLYTYGSGFSFQLGAIAKVTNEFRVGFTYESPTWLRLNDELKQALAVTGYNFNNANPGLSTSTPDSNTTIIYPAYHLQTPSKFTGSAAYVFGKKGLVSLDYSLKNYGATKFTPTSDSKYENADIAATFRKSAAEVRLGAEYKIKQWSLRGGYRYEQSPYKNRLTIGDGNSYSTGLGYNFGNTKIDLSYILTKREYNQPFFSQGFTDSSKINTTNNNVSLTLLFEL